MNKLIKYVYNNLIKPILTSVAPVREMSWGVAMGFFLGLTPTVGIQLYLTTLVWAVCRYLFRFMFNLPAAMTIIWISNPITMIPLYYVFLLTGNAICDPLNIPYVPLTYETFYNRFSAIVNQESVWASISEGMRFLVMELGPPILLGSLVYAVVMAVIGFFATEIILTRYRKRKAQKANMNYEEWCRQNETPMS